MGTVRVDFLVGGLNEVIKAFNSVQAAATKAYNAQMNANGGLMRRAKIVEKSLRDEEKLEQKRMGIIRNSLQKEQNMRESAEKRNLSIKRNSFAQEQSAREAWENKKRSILQSSLRYEQSLREKDARDAKAVQDKKLRDEKSAADRRLRQEESQRKQHLQIVKNSSAKAAALDRERIDGRERFGSAVGSRVAMGARRALGTMAGMAGAAMAIGGGYSAVDAVRSRMALERQAAVISNKAYIPGVSTGRVDPTEITQLSTSLARATGTDASTLQSGLEKYLDVAGDYEGGKKNLGFYAKLAKGSGADLVDVMGFAGSLKAQNRNASAEEIRGLVSGMAGTARQYHVSFQDAATAAASATSTSAAYGGDQEKTQRQLLGMLQLARATSRSPEEAATAVARLASDAGKHAGNLRGAGLGNVFDKNGLITSPVDLVEGVLKKTGGNLLKMQALGFNERSIKLFRGLAPEYLEAEAKEKGGGAKFIHERIQSAVEGKLSDADVETEFAKVMASDAEKLDAVFRDLNLRLGELLSQHMPALIEALQKLVPLIVNMTDKIAKFVEWFANNPLAGIGVVMAASIAAELASAGIGVAVKQAIVGLIVAAGEGSVGAGLLSAGIKGGIPTGALASAGVIGAVAVGAGALGMAGIDALANKSAADQRDAAVSDIQGAQEAFAAIRSGNADRQRAALASIQRDTEAKKAGPAWYEYETDGAHGARQRDIKFNESVVKALEDAIKKAAGNTVAGGGPGSNRSGAPQAARSNMNTPG